MATQHGILFPTLENLYSHTRTTAYLWWMTFVVVAVHDQTNGDIFDRRGQRVQSLGKPSAKPNSHAKPQNSKISKWRKGPILFWKSDQELPRREKRSRPDAKRSFKINSCSVVILNWSRWGNWSDGIESFWSECGSRNKLCNTVGAEAAGPVIARESRWSGWRWFDGDGW